MRTANQQALSTLSIPAHRLQDLVHALGSKGGLDHVSNSDGADERRQTSVLALSCTPSKRQKTKQATSQMPHARSSHISIRTFSTSNSPCRPGLGRSAQTAPASQQHINEPAVSDGTKLRNASDTANGVYSTHQTPRIPPPSTPYSKHSKQAMGRGRISAPRARIGTGFAATGRWKRYRHICQSRAAEIRYLGGHGGAASRKAQAEDDALPCQKIVATRRISWKSIFRI